MLKRKEPSLSSLTSDGNTSFLRAARAGQLEKVLEHLKSNIDINTSNANGLNALHLASKDGHVEVVDELLKRGAVVDAATKKGNTALHIASLAGQEEVVRILVHHGASVNVQSQNGFTPLYMAAQENHDNVVKYLLANGANQSLATEDGFTPLAVAMQQGHDKVVTVLLENDTRGKVRLPALHIAAKKDDVKAAKLLLENEHNPDVTSKSGFTPLHIASHYGNEQIANLLIVKGADVNYAAKHNITPLHVAAKWGKSNMVLLLLEKGANIESKTRDGLTPLHCAARSGHEQVVDMLLDRGAPISCKTKNGLAPLHMAAQGDHVEAARVLLYHRAPVDEVTVDYLTALHVAAHCGHVRVAKLLLDRQADANARALNGFTPLHIACKKNRIKVVELLLKHGASIGATTESGLTPLHVASFMGCMNIVIYLLQHDASPDAPTVRGETPLHLAARANQTDIIRILLRNGAQVDARAREQQTPLHIASRLGNVDIVMLLLQHGAKVDTTTKDMYTALHIAAKEGQDEVAAVLIEHGASLNATTKKGFTPLHLAAKYGNMKVAKLLLQKEAPVDAQGKNGVTPLHVASHYDHQNVALLLLDKGASPHATAKNGHTPLHIAARKNQMDIANTLLEYGAKPNAESKAGFTPLHLSAQEGHTDMSSLLIEHKANTNQPAKNGLTPLHLCAQEDRVPVAEILVKNGAEVDSATKGGFTPLHIASHYGQANMVKFLLANGANVSAITSLGYTPLHQAAQQGHTNIVNLLLENSAQPNAVTNNGQTPLNIAQKLGYISVIETLKIVTETTTTTTTTTTIEEKYKVVAPEAMQETFMSDSEEEGGEDTVLGDHSYRYLTADEMKSLGDDSLPIDVTRDERIDSNKMVTSDDQNMLPPQAIEDGFSPQYITENYVEYTKKYVADNVDIARHPINIGFLVSFLVDARGGAMRGCRHSGVRVIVPPRCAPSPTRITCRYVRPQRTPHPPPLMEGEALASRVLELGPVGAKFLGPVIIEVPHFAALRGKEREIVILRSDNGETWREHTVDSSEEILNEVLTDSFEAEDLSQMEDVSSGRITRILTHDFPQYFAIVTRIRQEVHAIGPEGGMVSSTVVPQVQAVFPQGALTKKIKVGLQAQPIDPELSAKLLGHGVAVSPVVTVEPRRRKFHKAITLSMPAPRAHSQGMINQYSGNAPTLRLLCSITGGTTRAQWEDVTGSTPLTFVNDCVSFTTTVSARFWLMDCRNIGDATKMATELYREAIHVPFMAKFVVFAKRIDPLEARLRVFCMTDDKEDKTLEHQEHFTEVAKSRDVEVLEGKPQYIEFAGNLVPITKSGEPLQFSFRAFRENRLPFSVRVKDQHAEALGRCLFMREPKVAKGEPPQQPICILNIVLPDDIVTETHSLTDLDVKRPMFEYYRPDPRLADMSNLLGEDWVPLATQLGLTPSEINVIKSEYPDSVAKQAQSMLRMWISQSGNKAQGDALENALRRIGREDIIPQCLNVEEVERIPRYRKKDIEYVLEEAPRRTYESKYSAEEKDVNEQEPSDEEDFNKTVSERREQIQKRLTEMIIPASQQRQEIVEEITSIKRQSMVEDKIAEVETKQKPEVETKAKPEVTTKVTKTVGDAGPGTKTVIETVETLKTTENPADYPPSEVTVTKQFMEDDTPDRKTTVRTIITETRTIEHFPSNEIADKTDSELLECVSQRLESRRAAPRISTTEVDPYSPKLSKTPPPSPADFIFREQQAAMQGWSATDGKSKDKSSPPVIQEDDVQEVSDVPLTKTRTAEPTNTETIPKPKPRSTKSPDTQLTSSFEKSETIPSTEEDQQQPPSSPPGTYSDKKKFWETITKDGQPEPTIKKRMSLYEETSTEKINLISKRTSIHEVSMEPPVPKPRATLPSAQSISETKEPEEDTEFPPTSEYKSSFIDPSLRPSPKPEEPTQDSDSDQEETSSVNHSAGYENTGYISDAGDVEHYISDSEIEDRVPQLRDRQMSVFHPPSGMKKSIYERSMSLPTEDLYDVKHVLQRKQYYEEKIRQEMVEEQLNTELEEEASPERKTLSFASEDEPCSSRASEERTIPESSSVKDIARTFGETVTPSIPSLHKESIEKEPEDHEVERKSVRDLAKGFETESGSIVMGQKKIQSKIPVRLVEETTKYIEESIDDSTTDFTMQDFETSEELGSKELDEFSRMKPFETLDLQDIQESSKLSLTTFDSELQLKVKSDIKGEADILADDMSEFEEKSEESKITYASEIEKDSLVMRDAQKVSEEQPSLRKIKEQELESDLSEVDQKSDASRITYASDIEKDTYKEEPVSSLEEVDSKEETSILEYDKCNGRIEILEKHLEEATHKTEITSHVQQSSTESEQSVFSDTGVNNFKDQDLTSKPSDSMEVHVDKSEIEDSEKLTDLEQDATDIETKSLDSLNATEMSPKSSFYTEETIPEITISLSGKQRRISEESDEYESKPKAKSDKHVNQPEEHIQDTVWEVSVESQPQDFDERVEEFIEKQVEQDRSEASRTKSQNHSEIEKMILESLHQQKISEEDAQVIASELLADIEAEIQRRHSSPDVTEAGVSDLSQNDVSEYLKQLAEAKGLDSREVQLVQSVLARKQRQLNKLSRGDTQASSMEITDEDLRYSGGEIDSRRNILEEQIEHLEVERSVERKLSRELGLINIGDHFRTEKAEDSPSESESKSFDDVKSTEHKTEKDTKVTEKYQSDKERTKSFSRDEVGVIKGEISEKEITAINAKVSTKESQFVKDDKYEAVKTEATDIEEDTKNICGVTITISETIVDDASSKSELKMKEEEKELSKITGTYTAEEKITDGTTQQDIKTAKMVEEQSKSEIEAVVDKKEEVKITDDIEQKTSETSTHKKISSSTVVIDSSHTESKTTTKFTEDVLPEDIPQILKEKVESVTTVTEIKRTSSDDSKSDDIRSPEEPISTSSSGKKSSSDRIPEVILRKGRKDDTSSGSPIFRPDRKSGIDFEAYSSSGESHYQSFELDSGRSRPCSSDVEGLIAAGSSEYESALTEQDVSAQTHMTSYHTAVSSLSSKESMKSLDSESSGNLASIEVSEASKTLVPSECYQADTTGHAIDDFSVDRVRLPTRQSTEFSDSELIYPDNQESIDVSEDDVLDKDGEDVPSKMKRSCEMTFQPEPKILVPESPHLEPSQEMDEKFGTSLDEGSVLSVSLSSTSSATALRTVIEQAQDRLESSLSTSVASDQFITSIASDQFIASDQLMASDQPIASDQLSASDQLISSDQLVASDQFIASDQLIALDQLIASDQLLDETSPVMQHSMSTSTHSQEESEGQVDSVTITTATVDENGISSVSTQVTSRGPDDLSKSKEEPFDPKKRGHRRCESTVTSNILSSMTTEADKKLQSDLAESDKYTALSLKEGKSDEKKDVDETEKDDYYDTEADQGFHRDLREGRYTDTEYELDVDSKENDVFDLSRPHSQVSLKSDSERERIASTAYSDSELADLAKAPSEPVSDPIERPHAPEPCEEIKDDTPEFSSEAQASIADLEQEYTSAIARSDEISEIKKQILMEVSSDKHHKEIFDKRDSTTGKLSSTSSEKSSFEEAEAEAAFSMVAHISPAHKVKQICPILEDEDAEKHELETRERAQKEYERRRQQQRDLSPGSIPDIKVTQHMAPLIDRGFHYPDLELEEKEEAEPKSESKSESKTEAKSEHKQPSPSSSSEKESKTCTTVLEETEEPEDMVPEEVTKTSEKPEKIVYKTQDVPSAPPVSREELPSPTDSPNSDSFEMLEKPDLIDDFVVIEEVAKEAHEMDTEGKSVKITSKKYIKKTDKEIEEYLVKSAPSPSTKMTDIKYYPDGSSSEELGFDFEESPPQPGEDKSASSSGKSPRDYIYEYDKELEANKKWIEQQFQGNQAAMIAAGYGYEMEFERGPLEDIKEEDINDLESRIGSLSSQKESGGSLGSVKDSYSSTPEYDVLAGRKYFTRSGEHDDVSMSSLQEFENLERAMSLENRRCIAGSQDSSSNGSFKNRIYPGRSGQGDDVSVSSLKEFEGLEKACIAAHKIEVKVKEEEAMLAQIDEGQESLASESESCETISGTDKKLIPDSDDEDYERRMFEIDEIIKQAQTNVERFIEIEKTESLGRGDSFEEVAKVPDLDLDAPLPRGAVQKAQWSPPDDVMVASTDSLDLKPEKPMHSDSTDSLDQKVIADVMTASTDSIEFQSQKAARDNIMSDSIEIKDKNSMITSDSLEMVAGARSSVMTSDSIDEDGSRIGGFDQSSSSTGKDFSSSVKDDELVEIKPQHMLESTDSIASTSTATHATYQYETDSVLSGLKTVDVAAAVKKVWFDEDAGASSRMYSTEYVEDGSKPYVTEVIEPCDDDGYSHTIHRRVEMPPQVTKVTFSGSDADEQLRQFIANFGEGEEVQESEEIDQDGNVHVKRVVQKRFVIKGDDQDPEGVMSRTLTDEKGTKTVYTQQFDLHHQQHAAHSVSMATTGERSTGESSDLATTRTEQPQTSTATKPEADEHSSQRPQESEQERSVSDQHQLSDEMRRLLKELEEESKK